MTGKKDINPFLKQVLELGPPLAFFFIYLRLRDDSFLIGGIEYSGFIIATIIFVPLMLGAMGILWYLTGKLSRMQIFTAFMVIFFGGLTAWFNDERFFKMKPTLIYLLFGGALTVGLMRGESWLEKVMEGMMPLQHEGWMILTKRITLFFFGLAVLNELVWRTQSTDMWVTFKTFGLTIAIFGFFLFQGGLFKRYALEEDEE